MFLTRILSFLYYSGDPFLCKLEFICASNLAWRPKGDSDDIVGSKDFRVSLFLEEGFAIILVESTNLFNFLRFPIEFSSHSSSLSLLQELWLLLFSENMLSLGYLFEEDESMILFLRPSFF